MAEVCQACWTHLLDH